MAEFSVAALLARTATHEANAWLFSIAAGAAGSFEVLFVASRVQLEYTKSWIAAEAHREAEYKTFRPQAGASPKSEYRSSGSRRAGQWPSEYTLLALVLAVAIVGAALGAAVLPIVIRLPAAIAARDVRALLVGDRMAIGALAGFAIAGGLTARRLRIEPMRALDRLAPSMGALVVLGRVGCFLEGCDFGAVTGVAWGVVYPAGSHAFEHQLATGLVRATDAAALPVHPAQLYEALAGLAMIAVAVWVLRRADSGIARSGAGVARDGLGLGPSSRWPRGPAGLAFRASIAVYAVARFVIEPLRGDPRPFLGPLSMPQWLCFALVAWAIGGLVADGGAASEPG